MNEEHVMRTRNKPEVLAPAGNLRGLKTAVDYGADAVYCGGKAFGMRSAPRNLSLEDFEEGSRYAHERGARVYVTCNVLPRNAEVEDLKEYLGQLKDTGVDALIAAAGGACCGYSLFLLIRRMFPRFCASCLLTADCIRRHPALKWEGCLLTLSALGSALLLAPLIRETAAALFL